jgi:hypothetical protein
LFLIVQMIINSKRSFLFSFEKQKKSLVGKLAIGHLRVGHYRSILYISFWRTTLLTLLSKVSNCFCFTARWMVAIDKKSLKTHNYQT